MCGLPAVGALAFAAAWAVEGASTSGLACLGIFVRQAGQDEAVKTPGFVL